MSDDKALVVYYQMLMGPQFVCPACGVPTSNYIDRGGYLRCLWCDDDADWDTTDDLERVVSFTNGDRHFMIFRKC